MNKNKIFIRGREKSDRGREVGLEGEGSGGRGGGKWEGSGDRVPPCPPPHTLASLTTRHLIINKYMFLSDS